MEFQQFHLMTMLKDSLHLSMKWFSRNNKNTKEWTKKDQYKIKFKQNSHL